MIIPTLHGKGREEVFNLIARQDQLIHLCSPALCPGKSLPLSSLRELVCWSCSAQPVTARKPGLCPEANPPLSTLHSPPSPLLPTHNPDCFKESKQGGKRWKTFWNWGRGYQEGGSVWLNSGQTLASLWGNIPVLMTCLRSSQKKQDQKSHCKPHLYRLLKQKENAGEWNGDRRYLRHCLKCKQNGFFVLPPKIFCIMNTWMSLKTFLNVSRWLKHLSEFKSHKSKKSLS